MSELIGFIYAVIAAIVWGTHLVPFKKMKANIYYSQFLMCLGIFLLTSLMSILFKFPLSLSIPGLVAGVIWTIGNFSALSAIREIGISRAFPIWISNTLVMFTWGVVLFKELTSLPSLVLGLLGVLLIFIGCVLVGRTKKEKEKSTKKGIILALIAALFFGSGFVPLKLTEMSGEKFFFQMSTGIMITSTFIFILRIDIPKDLQITKGLLTGFLWAIANLFGIYATLLLGLSRGGPMTQTAALMGALWGLFYFKEFKEKKRVIRIIVSSIIVVTGAILIGLAG
ncbi:MAG: GRP family sugar transporter [Candidatus Aenigmarchaeota archaeon]|nr:GRP family sugar transporter [Candidatus Aenigmarchaeota archaeon]